MATLLSDDFNRANSTTVVGAPQIGPTPTVPLGVAGINTNLLYASTAPANIIYALGTTDVEMSAVFSVLGTSNPCSFIIGYASATNYYLISVRPTQGIEIFKQEPGGAAFRYAYTGRTPNSAGANVKVHHKAGIIRVWLEGELVVRHDITDQPAITATSHGVRPGSAAVRVDNLLVVDAPTIAESTASGDLVGGVDLAGDELYADPGFAYLGRDLKTQDAAAGA